MRDVIACYDKLVCLFERVHLYLERLNNYNNTKLSSAMMELLGKIMAQVLHILALSAKEMKSRLLSMSIYLAHFCLSDYEIERFLKALLGRTSVDDALLRLDMFTKQENLMARTKVLKVTQNVHEDMNNVVKTTQAVHDPVNKLETETRIANRAAQVTSASVYRSPDVFIDVLTDFLQFLSLPK